MSTVLHYDIVVIGSGPAGQKAAIQGAKAGKHVAMIEREPGVGGSCVYRGTIPSLSSNSKCNTASPDGLRCCHDNKMLHTLEC